MQPQALKHLEGPATRVMVVDGSKLVRKLIADVLQRDLPGVEVIGCDSIEDAQQALAQGPVDLVTTSLTLRDGDGLALARMVRRQHFRLAAPARSWRLVLAKGRTAWEGSPRSEPDATFRRRCPLTRRWHWRRIRTTSAQG